MSEAIDEAAEAAAVRAAEAHGDAPDALIEMLHDVQDALGWVPEAALRVLAGRINRTGAEVHGVASFYHDFRTAPGARGVLKLCAAEACRAVGAEALIAETCRRVGAALGETSAGGVRVEAVYCLGACACGPAASVDGRLVARARAEGLAAEVSA